MDTTKYAPGCNPTSTGEIVCVDPPMCFKPAVWVCDPNSVTVSCRCEMVVTQAPGRLCTASIAYGVNTPHLPWLVPMEAHCDAAGAELALAVIIAKLLGAR